MSLRSRFLSRKLSKSFRELDRRAKEKEQEKEEERAAVVAEEYHSGTPYGTTWSTILPELLEEIIKRLEATEDHWQRRQNIVASAGVCKRWRDITKETFNSHRHGGTITFPSCLKQQGPSGSSNQCLIRRNKKTSTFCLYLARSPSLTDKGKFLLAARRYRRASHIEYIISLHDDDYSQRSNAYVGKLSSDFLGTNFTIYDSEAPHRGARPMKNRASRRFSSKQISPQLPGTNYEVGHISYKFNLLKSRGPRRMVCSIKCPDDASSSTSSSSSFEDEKRSSDEQVVLKNKAPRWHEQLQCWCLNFHGRVTVASVKNFQLVSSSSSASSSSAAAGASNNNNENLRQGKGDDDTVVLQFGRVDDDLFTMDYRHPLSTFQAFAICLTSFGTKIACE